jgi:hypothetical protein
MMKGALPPSSKLTRFTVPVHCCINRIDHRQGTAVIGGLPDAPDKGLFAEQGRILQTGLDLHRCLRCAGVNPCTIDAALDAVIASGTFEPAVLGRASADRAATPTSSEMPPGARF